MLNVALHESAVPFVFQASIFNILHVASLNIILYRNLINKKGADDWTAQMYRLVFLFVVHMIVCSDSCKCFLQQWLKHSAHLILIILMKHCVQ